MALSESTVKVLKATAPWVKEHSTEVTMAMYKLLFAEYPQCRDLFNMSHHRKNEKGVSPQGQTLANALVAYASHCDDLGALGPAVDQMVQKHISFHILPEHYDMVGDCLIRALGQVLADAATDEIVNGWKDAYKFLADLLIGLEEKAREEKAALKGGWEGYRSFMLMKKEVESDDITSFYLKPEDNGRLLDFEAGQYLSFCFPKDTIVGFDHDIVRNYSLSCGTGQDHYRVSVKRETSASAETPSGAVSNFFHDKVDVGCTVMTGVPCGSFRLNVTSPRPVVLISGGVGLTPMLSMLDTLAQKEGGLGGNVTWVHSTRSAQSHAFAKHVDQLDGVRAFVFYTQAAAADVDSSAFKNTKVAAGRLTKERLGAIVGDVDSDFYYCGPDAFMSSVRAMLIDLGANKEHIYCESFGPSQ